MPDSALPMPEQLHLASLSFVNTVCSVTPSLSLECDRVTGLAPGLQGAAYLCSHR